MHSQSGFEPGVKIFHNIQKTYLQGVDPDLIRKISEYLKKVKQPKEDDIDKEDDDNNDEEQIRGMIKLADIGPV